MVILRADVKGKSFPPGLDKGDAIVISDAAHTKEKPVGAEISRRPKWHVTRNMSV
jgi:hypothetical protein